jgi:hypothetical protein
MRHNGLTKQLKANAPCVMHALLIDPDSSAVIVSTNDGIISQQKATSQGKTHHLHDGNIIRRKYLNACQSSQTSHGAHVPTHFQEQAANPSTAASLPASSYFTWPLSTRPIPYS